MRHAKALLFPIEVEEAFGIVMIEAGAAGTPVLAFRRGAVPEVIEQGKTGFYADSAEELASYVRHLDTINPHYCRSRTLKHFSVDRMIDGYLQLYKTVLKEAGTL